MDLETEVLKGVSRSFYLTLRLLPAPMRSAASLGYLLARTSDTIADTAEVPTDARITALDDFSQKIHGLQASAAPWPAALLRHAEPREQVLLHRTHDLFRWLAVLPDAQAELVREVLAVIISGQKLDLLHFAEATAAAPIALADAASLEDYCWRVAGCVGAFWTKLGWLTLGDAFSSGPEPALLHSGIQYGMGLQLVNILRDLPRDLANGRCYLPVKNPLDRSELLASHRAWLETAMNWSHCGEIYSATLGSRRLRIASILPAMLARETLIPMRDASWETLSSRVKIPRRRVYALLFSAIFRTWKS